jgi:hypothetical protein
VFIGQGTPQGATKAKPSPPANLEILNNGIAQAEFSMLNALPIVVRQNTNCDANGCIQERLNAQYQQGPRR